MSRFLAGALVTAVALPVAAESLKVALVRPKAGENVFGPVRVAVEVTPPGAAAMVEIFVDGRRAGVLREPPFELLVDTGGENVAHTFRAVARGRFGGEASASVSTPAIRVDAEFSADLQQLYVTARRGGERVLDLDRAEFTILDEGKGQAVVSFARGDVPFTAIVLLDASASMEESKLATAIAGAQTFVGGMRPLDEAKLIAFSDRIAAATPFAGPGHAVAADLGRVTADGGTSVNDNLYLALKLLEARQGRRVVILLSDGMDVTSALRMREVLHKARQSQALIYWIRPLERGGRVLNKASASVRFSSWRNGPEHAEELRLIEQAVEESGGRIFEANPLDDLAAEFGEILSELREQYVLGFYPADPRHDGRWHRVEVRVRRPGIETRGRGYLDF